MKLLRAPRPFSFSYESPLDAAAWTQRRPVAQVPFLRGLAKSKLSSVIFRAVSEQSRCPNLMKPRVSFEDAGGSVCRSCGDQFQTQTIRQKNSREITIGPYYEAGTRVRFSQGARGWHSHY